MQGKATAAAVVVDKFSPRFDWLENNGLSKL